ncbi:MAG: aldo/keto reductase, partial [Candidatus Parcubacteria bacterium]|nr:aldo/keto reductase [Candidatus Parcubacteria bacterium]
RHYWASPSFRLIQLQMKTKNLKNGFKIPVLGLGTWEIGGTKERDASRDREWIGAIQNAIRSGLTHIDTAETYGDGHCEEVIGEAIRSLDRSKIFLTTKVHKVHLRPADLIRSCQNSLRRLRTSYIDLYLIHSPSLEIPLNETMPTLDGLVAQGLIKNLGVSNFSAEQIKEAQSLSKNKIVACQVQYNLLVRNNGKWSSLMEKKFLPYCQKNDMIFIAFQPIARGRLCGPENLLLMQLAKKYNKTPAQVAINWLISKKNVVTIFKATNPEHLRENMGALGWNLSSDDMESLNQLSTN